MIYRTFGAERTFISEHPIRTIHTIRTIHPKRPGRDNRCVTTARRVMTFLAVLFFSGVAMFVRASSVSAQSSLDTTPVFDVDLDVQRDGSMRVTETITQSFATPRHGIERAIPLRQSVGNHMFRRYPISDIQVTADQGTPSKLFTTEANDTRTIRIGDANQTISGTHTYTIRYTVRNATSHFEANDELYWNAIGTQWRQNIGKSTVTVHLPVAVNRVKCFKGRAGGDLACDSNTFDGSSATFTAEQLAPSEAFTVVVGAPPNTLGANPILEKEKSPLQRVASDGWPGIATFLGGSGAVTAFIRRKGRDKNFVGLPLAASRGEIGTEGKGFVGRGDRKEGPVEFGPPENHLPALLASLEKFSASKEMLTGTIVDLAMRGYLSITEEGEGRTWRLDALPPGPRKGPALLAFELHLLEALFASHPSVRVEDLDQKFHSAFTKFTSEVNAELQNRNWVEQSSMNAGRLLTVAGFAMLVAGGWLGIKMFEKHSYKLASVGAAMLLLGPVLFIGAKLAPARSSVGSALLVRTRGFRRFLEAGEDRLDHAERAQMFIDFLPYAISFGIIDKWTKRFADLTTLPQTTWYNSYRPFNPIGFGGGMRDFERSATKALTSSPPSSSGGSGFSGGSSGGGGGGGGGGSW